MLYLASVFSVFSVVKNKFLYKDEVNGRNVVPV